MQGEEREIRHIPLDLALADRTVIFVRTTFVLGLDKHECKVYQVSDGTCIRLFLRHFQRFKSLSAKKAPPPLLSYSHYLRSRRGHGGPTYQQRDWWLLVDCHALHISIILHR